MSQILPKLIKTAFHPSLISNVSKNSISCISSCNVKKKFIFCEKDSGHPFTCSLRSNSGTSSTLSEVEKLSLLSSQMNMRMVNENSFLSWCRNSYLSSVIGVAMMDQASSTLAQGAGFGALLIGGMNLFWGTGCHISNLIRLRHVTGMSTFTLTLNVLGSFLHCLFFSIVLVLYLGFLDEELEKSDAAALRPGSTEDWAKRHLRK